MRKDKITRFERFTMVLPYIVLLAIIFVFVILYQLPALDLVNKKTTCINHGFFDYIEETDECRTLYYITVKPYEEVAEHQHWGSHCDIVDECVKLKSSLNAENEN